MPLVTDAIRTGQQSGRVHEHLDPEAWLVELVLTLVGSFAVDSVASSLIPGDPDALRARRTKELLVRRLLLAATKSPSSDKKSIASLPRRPDDSHANATNS